MDNIEVVEYSSGFIFIYGDMVHNVKTKNAEYLAEQLETFMGKVEIKNNYNKVETTNNCEVLIGRCRGNSIRRAMFAMDKLLQGYQVEIIDHWNSPMANRFLLNRVVELLSRFSEGSELIKVVENIYRIK